MSTAHVTRLAPPISRSDVTSYDDLWRPVEDVGEEELRLLSWEKGSGLTKDSTKRNPGELSPPLKYLTEDWTRQLIETLDPLDAVDSASDRSASSADTMIMMTSEEERRNREHIQKSLLNFDLRRALAAQTNVENHSSSPSSSRRSFGNVHPVYGSSLSTPAYAPPHSTYGRDTAPQYPQNSKDTAPLQHQTYGRETVPAHSAYGREHSAPQLNPAYSESSFFDDGYGTDSRSNTSASTSSPLSSSLSSLSTLEGSHCYFPSNGHQNSKLSSGVLLGSPTMQRGPIQKGPNPHLPARNSGGAKLGGVPVKRREVHVESKDNVSSLEDRLRALTTIEEEDAALSAGERGFFKGGIPARTNWRGHTQIDSNDERQDLNVSGCFHAVPVEVKSISSRSSNDSHLTGSGPYRSSGYNVNHNPPDSRSPQMNGGDAWMDYSKFLEKDCDISIHNIDPVGKNKFSNTCVDNVPDMDINRRIGTGSPANPKKVYHSGHPHRPPPPPSPLAESPLVPRRGNDHFGQDSVPPHNSVPVQLNHGNRQPPSSPYLESPVVQRRLADQLGGLMGSIGSTGHIAQSSTHPPRDVMTSMPDLRSHDPTASPRLSQRQHQDSYPGYPFYKPSQYHQSLQQQLQQQQLQQQQQFQPQRQQQFGHSSFDYPQPYSGRELQPDLPMASYPAYSASATNLSSEHSASLTSLRSAHRFPTHDDRLDDTTPVHPEYPEVVLRRPHHLSSSARASPRNHERFSWQPETMYQQQQQLQAADYGNAPAERASLDLGNIPQLQKQIRASSELCLQAARSRHVFASSADIYKLFSGQKKVSSAAPSPTPSSPRQQDRFTSDTRHQPARHSFHMMPRSAPGSHPAHVVPPSHLAYRTSSPATSTSSKSNLHVVIPSVSSPGPVRADHNLAIPPDAWTDVPPASGSGYPGQDDLDRTSFRQSSGYSSENELQQIEINARAVRKLQKKLRQAPIGQEFVPLNSSADRDSLASSCKDQTDDPSYNEPVYMNQTMFTGTPQFPTTNFGPSNSNGQHSNPAPSTEQFGHFTQPSTSTSLSMLNQPPTSATGTQIQTVPSKPTKITNVVTQHQVINFSRKPIQITSHVPSNLFYTEDEDTARSTPSSQNQTKPTASSQFGARPPQQPQGGNGGANSDLRQALKTFQEDPTPTSGSSNSNHGPYPHSDHLQHQQHYHHQQQQQHPHHYQEFTLPSSSQGFRPSDSPSLQTHRISRSNSSDGSQNLQQLHAENPQIQRPHRTGSTGSAQNLHHTDSPNLQSKRTHRTNSTGSSQNLTYIDSPSLQTRRAHRAGSTGSSQRLSPLSSSGNSRRLPAERSSSSGSSHQLSPLEIAQVLDTPFSTNIISDEKGDRLSTLV